MGEDGTPGLLIYWAWAEGQTSFWIVLLVQANPSHDLWQDCRFMEEGVQTETNYCGWDGKLSQWENTIESHREFAGGQKSER